MPRECWDHCGALSVPRASPTAGVWSYSMGSLWSLLPWEHAAVPW